MAEKTKAEISQHIESMMRHDRRDLKFLADYIAEFLVDTGLPNIYGAVEIFFAGLEEKLAEGREVDGDEF